MGRCANKTVVRKATKWCTFSADVPKSRFIYLLRNFILLQLTILNTNNFHLSEIEYSYGIRILFRRIYLAQLTGAVRCVDFMSAEESDFPNGSIYTGYDIKQSDAKVRLP